jgi:hypothetical protein
MGLHATIVENDEDDMKTITVEVLSTAVGVTAPPPLLAELQAALADLEAASSADRELALIPGERGFDLREEGRIIRRGVDPAIAATTLIWRLNAIAGESSGHVLIHGACVAGPLGGAVLLPAGKGAGKSTLTAACVRAGLAYVSDELVALDCRTGTITPYRKPVALDGERLVPASSLGRVETQPPTPTAIVFPRYEAGAAVSEAPLDPGWTLVALAAHTTNLAALRSTGFAWLAGLALTCPARQLTHGDAAQVVAAIARAADARGRPVAPAQMLPRVSEETTTVAMGDSLAVLHEPSGKVHLLNRSAAATWCRAALAAYGRSSLLDTVVDWGDLENQDRATTAVTIDWLVRSGLLPAPAGT